MGEAMIFGANQSGEFSAKAIIRVKTPTTGATVTCIGPEGSFSESSTGSVDFDVGYGSWTITTIANGSTISDTVTVTDLKIYMVDHSIKIYGIEIDMDNLDPTDAVSYIGSAVGFTSLSCASGTGVCNYGSWEDIITNGLGIKPCLYLNGNRSVYLNPNNYSQNISGTSVDITGGSGDVMVEFASRWYKYSKEGNKLRFEVSDTATVDLSSKGFVKTAFLSEDGTATPRDYFYYGAYEGYISSSILRSRSNAYPTVSTSYDAFITAAKATGVKYTIETLTKRMYILGLLMLVTKSRDGQATIGQGVINSSKMIATGTMNTNGLFFGRSDVATSGVKVFGIENFWGNLYRWIAGLVTMNTTGALGIKNCAPYSPSGSGYITVNTGWGTGYGYPKVYTPFMNGSIILPSEKQSDGTKCWSDDFWVHTTSASLVALAGGHRLESLASSGPFYCTIANLSSVVSTDVGSRLVSS